MNKQEIAIVVVLVALLFGWMHYQGRLAKQRAAAQAEIAAVAATNEVPAEVEAPVAAEAVAEVEPAEPSEPAAEVPQVAPMEELVADSGAEEQTIKLADSQLEVTLSSKGGTISGAKFFGYPVSITNKDDLALDFTYGRALAVGGINGLGERADFAFVSNDATSAVLRCTSPDGVTLTRRIALGGDYRISVEDSLANGGKETLSVPAATISMGLLEATEQSRNGLLSVDHLPTADNGKVTHWEKKGRVAKMFGGGAGGGFGCSRSGGDASMLPIKATQHTDGGQAWVALKTRFFAQVLVPSVPASGFDVVAYRKDAPGALNVEALSAKLASPAFEVAPGAEEVRSYSMYIGPKKLSVIKKFGYHTGEIMDFGMFKWLCVLLVPMLNILNRIFCNYGVAIIVLTLIVRGIFWPLTRKSNEGMRKMQAVQPQLKELQAKFKDEPQKLQQETMKLYRDNHVNPFSSCLPMLIQIPVFIALFVVLRSAVELRFAPFLWVSDLSEPENLLAGAVPFVHSLNILPILMAATMFLQSKLTPSTGDPQQQRMMMVIMPLMMLFMFYSMPSALLLYWTVSQVLAIVQLWIQKRKGAADAAAKAAPPPSDDRMTRQARRLAERG